QLAQQSPATSGLLAQPQKAAVSYDDTENLSAIEKAVRVLAGIGQSAVAAVPSMAQGFYGVVQAGAEGLATVTNPLAGTILPENPFARVAAGVAQWRQEQEALAKGLRPKGFG